MEETREFITCVQEDTAPSATGIDGKIPILMGIAANQSLEEHRPVQVKLGNNLY